MSLRQYSHVSIIGDEGTRIDDGQVTLTGESPAAIAQIWTWHRDEERESDPGRFRSVDRLIQCEVSDGRRGEVVITGNSQVLRYRVGVPEGDERVTFRVKVAE